MNLESLGEPFEVDNAGDPAPGRGETRDLAIEAVALAEKLLAEAQSRETRSQHAKFARMARMMGDPKGKALTLALVDQAFRSRSPSRAADQFRHLVEAFGVPDFLPFWERFGMRVGAWASRWAPWLVMPLVTAKLRMESSDVILPSEEEKLKPYLLERRARGTRLNINQLGEAILGEDEAQRRLEQNIRRLKSPEVEYISVKISSIFSQLNLIAFDQTVERIKERLRSLYRTAMAHQFRRSGGNEVPKFVNLDMEEYRDLHLTTAAFKQVLMEEEFAGMEAGVVLQAYLPDSFAVQKDLVEWTRRRVDGGGAGIKIRIVKGANLAMERVEASLHGWPQAPYGTKAEVDANFKRMVRFGCRPENARMVRLGIGSHNLFDICYALLIREQNGVEESVEFEMLEGMANHQAAAVEDAAGGLLLYAPVVKREDFHSAIAYLVRRLDENTAKENFLHDVFGLEVGSAAWEEQKNRFLEACADQDEVSALPNRSQNRAAEVPAVAGAEAFRNAPDTDWTLEPNRIWIHQIVERWKVKSIDDIPLQVGGEFVSGESQAEGHDPSRPGVVAYRHALGGGTQIEQALETAVAAQSSWEARSQDDRAQFLRKAAVEIARNRGETIACMTLDGGKAIPESDAEISEAVDFANYYADSWCDLREQSPDCTTRALGVVVITPPWNFPYAIPCGGILAALVAGNAVILKPAPEAVLTGWHLANHLWAAGIPREVLQFLPCPDNEIGKSLITDERVAAVVLTGAFETARMFQSWRPDLRLFAETSGKNSMIITAAADLDQAVKDLVKSAFGHAGQKCSAASLAILEAEVYDSETFRRQLRDAAASLKAGSAWDPESVITPVIREPDERLRRGLTILDEGEEWLLAPQMLEENPGLWSPGIRLGVQPGSWFHQTECFGPVLGLMRAESLDDAIRIQNDSSFGLTAGIQSLDTREIDHWKERVEAGNAYANRSITGAIVRRQPFGGWKNSCIGPGAKAGGPNYVANLVRWEQVREPSCGIELPEEIGDLVNRLSRTLSSEEERLMLAASARNYVFAHGRHFGVEHDPSAIEAEANLFRYRPCSRVVLRAGSSTSALELCLAILAARVCSVPLTLSANQTLTGPAGAVEMVDSREENEADWVESLSKLGADSAVIRVPGGASPDVHKAVQSAGLRLIDAPVLSNGRLELVHYFREQSVTETLHRYGNITMSGNDLTHSL